MANQFLSSPILPGTPLPKHHHSRLLILLVVALVVAIVIGAWMWWSAMQVPALIPVVNTPVVDQHAKMLAEMQTFRENAPPATPAQVKQMSAWQAKQKPATEAQKQAMTDFLQNH